MDKKNTKNKAIKAAARGRVSMTDLVGATGPTPTKRAKASTATPPQPSAAAVAGRRVDPNDKVINTSIAIRESELAELQEYADKHSASRGSLMTALVRYAMRDMRAGRVKMTVRALKFALE